MLVTLLEIPQSEHTEISKGQEHLNEYASAETATRAGCSAECWEMTQAMCIKCALGTNSLPGLVKDELGQAR